MEKIVDTNRERLKELFVHYELNKEDVFKHKTFGFVIVTRTGIEKIMAKDNILLDYEVVKCERDFCAVKCTATKMGGGERIFIHWVFIQKLNRMNLNNKNNPN